MVCALHSPASRRRWERVFLSLIPHLVRHAKYAFRHLPRRRPPAGRRPKTIGNALVAFVALVRCGTMAVAFPIVLARQARHGRPAQYGQGGRQGLP